MSRRWISPLFLVGCISCTLLVEFDELERISNSRGELEVVWIRTSGPVTSTPSWNFYLAKKGEQWERSNLILSTEGSQGLELVWRIAELLEFRFERIRVEAFKNYWNYYDASGRLQTVAIKLVPESDEWLFQRNQE